jgi:hypothetical protein
MAMETAAAILTKVALEQNTELKSKLNAARGEANVLALIMPLFRRVLSELEKEKQAHDKFPSAIPAPSSSRSAKAGLTDVESSKDVHSGEHRDEDDDVGGEG